MIRRTGLSVDMHKSHPLDTVPDDLMTKWSTQIWIPDIKLELFKHQVSLLGLLAKIKV